MTAMTLAVTGCVRAPRALTVLFRGLSLGSVGLSVRRRLYGILCVWGEREAQRGSSSGSGGRSESIQSRGVVRGRRLAERGPDADSAKYLRRENNRGGIDQHMTKYLAVVQRLCFKHEALLLL